MSRSITCTQSVLFNIYASCCHISPIKSLIIASLLQRNVQPILLLLNVINVLNWDMVCRRFIESDSSRYFILC
ncbi:hypothetical protein RB195_003964 [Necator americanus]|uniref:Uncharacterized protein n=1 Tax=Necator americanus TaxID=51031 RepID=A0ABR1DS74_NECAM